jgi:hypothetical protein
MAISAHINIIGAPSAARMSMLSAQAAVALLVSSRISMIKCCTNMTIFKARAMRASKFLAKFLVPCVVWQASLLSTNVIVSNAQGCAHRSEFKERCAYETTLR